MIQIDYPPQNLPRMEQICMREIPYEKDFSLQEIEQLENLGHFVVLLPCEDGLIVIQRLGIGEPNYPVTVTEH